MTTWKPIKDFPKYVVSDEGEVANVKNYCPLSISYAKRNHTTYQRVTLFNKGKRYYRQVHRLVAEAFCPNPNNLPEVDHQDNNGENNHWTNLAWVTRSENIQNSFARNLSLKLKICSNGGKVGGKVNQQRAEQKYKDMLQNRFIDFLPTGTVSKDAAIRYMCHCGNKRTASVMSKELRVHKGKCPVCTNTVNRSGPSLE